MRLRVGFQQLQQGVHHRRHRHRLHAKGMLAVSLATGGTGKRRLDHLRPASPGTMDRRILGSVQTDGGNPPHRRQVQDTGIRRNHCPAVSDVGRKFPQVTGRWCRCRRVSRVPDDGGDRMGVFGSAGDPHRLASDRQRSRQFTPAFSRPLLEATEGTDEGVQEDRSPRGWCLLSMGFCNGGIDIAELTPWHLARPAEGPDDMQCPFGTVHPTGGGGWMESPPPAWQFSSISWMDAEDSLGTGEHPNQSRTQVRLPVDEQVVAVAT